jgi:hypothetical protein
MNIVQYLERVYKMKMLSNNHPSYRIPYQYCCKTNPNHDDFEVYYDKKSDYGKSMDKNKTHLRNIFY